MNAIVQNDDWFAGGERMKRRFNITGSCSPERHYMVRLDDRLKGQRISAEF